MYSKTVMDHFKSPRNVGVIEGADGVGEVGNPLCGDMMTIYLKINEERIDDIRLGRPAVENTPDHWIQRAVPGAQGSVGLSHRRCRLQGPQNHLFPPYEPALARKQDPGFQPPAGRNAGFPACGALIRQHPNSDRPV